MKRNFLILSAFFLCSCSSDVFYENTGCPVSGGKEISVLFEFDSALLNEKAVAEIKETAREVKENDDYICFMGMLSYQGVSAYQAEGALLRIKNTAALFLSEGVKPERLYIGMGAQTPRIGLQKPQTAAEEEHTLNLLIGR